MSSALTPSYVRLTWFVASHWFDDFIRRFIKTLNSKSGTVTIALLIESLAFQNLSKNDRSADNFAEQHAELIFQLPQKTRYSSSMVIPKQDHLATIIMLRSDDPTWSCSVCKA